MTAMFSWFCQCAKVILVLVAIVTYIIKIKMLSSCEIEDFVETHLCKLCDTPIARITGCVLIKDIGGRLPLELQCSLYQGQQGDANQSARGNYETPF